MCNRFVDWFHQKVHRSNARILLGYRSIILCTLLTKPLDNNGLHCFKDVLNFSHFVKIWLMCIWIWVAASLILLTRERIIQWLREWFMDLMMIYTDWIISLLFLSRLEWESILVGQFSEYRRIQYNSKSVAHIDKNVTQQNLKLLIIYSSECHVTFEPEGWSEVCALGTDVEEPQRSAEE